MTQISAANALALGYELNFVRPVGHALLQMADGGPGTVTVDGSTLNREQLDNVTLTVVLPDSLSWANDDYIDQTLAQPGHLVTAVVEHPDFSRPRSTKCLPLVDGEPVRLIHPDQVWVAFGETKRQVSVEQLSGDERREAWEQIVARSPISAPIRTRPTARSRCCDSPPCLDRARRAAMQREQRQVSVKHGRPPTAEMDSPGGVQLASHPWGWLGLPWREEARTSRTRGLMHRAHRT